MNPGTSLDKAFADEIRNHKVKKKAKAGGKLSQNEISNLSTDELFTYIENQGKKQKQSAENKKQAAAAAAGVITEETLDAVLTQ